MADGVTRSPARLCSRDGKICYYYGRLEYVFSCFLCLASFFFSPSLSRHVYLLKDFVFLRLCNIDLLLSASEVRTSYFIVRVSSSCHSYPASSRNPFAFIRLIFFRSSYFSGGIFCRALVPGTLALDSPIYVRALILSRLLVFLCLTAVCDHMIFFVSL